jgi:hypothetical protein
MLNIALFGPPGAGKGTQSEFLIKKYNLFYISTGDLLRQEMSGKTLLGLEAQSIIAAGGLVPDEIIVQIIEKTITENPGCQGFLFDGFPRTYIQAYILEGLMLKLHTSLNCLLARARGGIGPAAARPRRYVRTQRRQRGRHPQSPARVPREDAAGAAVLSRQGHLPPDRRHRVNRRGEPADYGDRAR